MAAAASNSSRLFSILGAGYAGTMLYANQETIFNILLSSLRAATLPKAGGGGGGYSGGNVGGDEALKALAAQVSSLSALVAAHGQAPMRLPSVSGTTGLYLAGGVGVAGALALRIGLDELMYVSRATFGRGLRTITGGLTSLSTALERVKSSLTERIDRLQGRVEEGLVVQERMEATMMDAKTELEMLTQQVARVEEMLGEVCTKQEAGNRGIFALCHVVNSGVLGNPIGVMAGAGQGKAMLDRDSGAGVQTPTSRVPAGIVGGAVAVSTGAGGEPGGSTGRKNSGGPSIDEQLKTIQQLCNATLLKGQSPTVGSN